MPEHRFFPAPPVLAISEIAARVGAFVARGDPGALVTGAAPVESAGPGDITFLDNPKYAKYLASTAATACLCTPRYVDRIPDHVAVLQAEDPYRAYAAYLELAFPDALRPRGFHGDGQALPQSGTIHRGARLETGVCVEPGAVIGDKVEIGRGTIVAANAVIGKGVAIGRDCFVGSNTTLQHALLGNRVIVHPGVCIGQDGFGFAMGSAGHRKVAQIGRVIIQDDVEIGSNSTIDRGANRDTVVGEGTKIDNQVQIGHNVQIGRHCVIVAQVGISGSARLGDFVAVGGQTGINGHVVIGDGAQIAAVSVVHGDVPAGARWGGVPARPVSEWFREMAALRRLAQRQRTD